MSARRCPGADPGGQARAARAGRVRRRRGRNVASRSPTDGAAVSSRPSRSPGRGSSPRSRPGRLPPARSCRGADGKVETFALHYRRGRAAAISVVTEEDHFGGKPDWVPRAQEHLGAAGPDEGLRDRPSASSTSRSRWARMPCSSSSGRCRIDGARLAGRGGAERGLAAWSRRTTRRRSDAPRRLGPGRARRQRARPRDLRDGRAALSPRSPATSRRVPFRLAESGIRSRADVVASDGRRVPGLPGRRGASCGRGPGRVAAELCGHDRRQDLRADAERGRRGRLRARRLAARVQLRGLLAAPADGRAARGEIARRRSGHRSAAPASSRPNRVTKWLAPSAEVPLDYVQLHRPVTARTTRESRPRADRSPPCPSRPAGKAVPPDGILVALRRPCSGIRAAAAGRSPDWAALQRAGALPVPVFVAGGLDSGERRGGHPHASPRRASTWRPAWRALRGSRITAKL